jgi:hypothetical protein
MQHVPRGRSSPRLAERMVVDRKPVSLQRCVQEVGSSTSAAVGSDLDVFSSVRSRCCEANRLPNCAGIARGDLRSKLNR